MLAPRESFISHQVALMPTENTAALKCEEMNTSEFLFYFVPLKATKAETISDKILVSLILLTRFCSKVLCRVKTFQILQINFSYHHNQQLFQIELHGIRRKDVLRSVNLVAGSSWLKFLYMFYFSRCVKSSNEFLISTKTPNASLCSSQQKLASNRLHYSLPTWRILTSFRSSDFTAQRAHSLLYSVRVI